MSDSVLTVDDNPLELSNQLCFMLYSASRQMTAAYRPLLNELDITYPQYLVLMVLWEYFNVAKVDDCQKSEMNSESGEGSEQGVKVGELSSKLQLDSGTLTPLLKRMELQGLIVRARDRKDERVVRINLTSRGVKLRLRAVKVPKILMCNGGLDLEQVKGIHAELAAVLRKIPGLV